MEVDVISMVWTKMQSELERIRSSVRSVTTLTERAETAGGIESVLLAAAPLTATGSAAGDLLWISNGRKSGEAANAGTGVPAYFNPATNTWKRFEDNADVTI